MSKNRRIIAPHKEQDGWVYVRARRCKWQSPVMAGMLSIFRPEIQRRPRVTIDRYDYEFAPSDSMPGSRIISSRKVEEAVETADWLKRCAEEGMVAVFDYSDGWHVGLHTRSVAPLGGQRVTGAHGYGSGATLREAYWRYKNAVAR